MWKKFQYMENISIYMEKVYLLKGSRVETLIFCWTPCFIRLDSSAAIWKKYILKKYIYGQKSLHMYIEVLVYGLCLVRLRYGEKKNSINGKSIHIQKIYPYMEKYPYLEKVYIQYTYIAKVYIHIWEKSFHRNNFQCMVCVC